MYFRSGLIAQYNVTTPIPAPTCFRCCADRNDNHIRHPSAVGKDTVSRVWQKVKAEDADGG